MTIFPVFITWANRLLIIIRPLMSRKGKKARKTQTV